MEKLAAAVPSTSFILLPCQHVLNYTLKGLPHDGELVIAVSRETAVLAC